MYGGNSHTWTTSFAHSLRLAMTRNIDNQQQNQKNFDKNHNYLQQTKNTKHTLIHNLIQKYCLPPVAQSDRALDCSSRGWWFESFLGEPNFSLFFSTFLLFTRSQNTWNKTEHFTKGEKFPKSGARTQGR